MEKIVSWKQKIGEMMLEADEKRIDEIQFTR